MVHGLGFKRRPVIVFKSDRVLFYGPLCVQGDAAAHGESISCRVGVTAAVRRCIPASKGVSGLFQSAGVARDGDSSSFGIAAAVGRHAAACVAIAVVGDAEQADCDCCFQGLCAYGQFAGT